MKYQVSVNGSSVSVYPARVSAVPFNRVWPGSQRPLEQTETAWFSTFDFTGSAEIEVKVLDGLIRSVDLRPAEFEIPFEFDKDTIRIHLSGPRKFSVEVNGFHEALHLFGNEPLDFVPDENTLVFGPGETDAGLILPEDNQTIYLAEGAVVYGAVFCNHVKNVRILGRGILDSSRIPRGYEMDFTKDPLALKLMELGQNEFEIQHYWAGFTAVGSENILVDGIILRDPPFWGMNIRDKCSCVTIQNIKMIGFWRYNSDGIDIWNTDHAVVRDCYIRAFDDCLVVRGAHANQPGSGCSDVVMEDNVLWCDWGKNLEIWSGNNDSVIENVVFRRNHLVRVCGHAISIDTWYGSNSILVDGVLYEDNVIDTRGEALYTVYQDSDDMIYAPDKTCPAPQDGVYIIVGKKGKATGEQGCEEDPSSVEFQIRYRNIAFVGTRYIGKPLDTLIDKRDLTELSNLTFTDCEQGNLMIP